MHWQDHLRRLRAVWRSAVSFGPRRTLSRARRRLSEDRAYRSWLVGRASRRPARVEVEATDPLLSVLMPTHEPAPRWLRRAVDSLRAQSYSRWDLCVADDSSSGPDPAQLLGTLTRSDTRLRVTRRAWRGHISAASNSALEMARGDFVVLLDQDDELSPNALAQVVDEIRRHPDTPLVYSDEDKLDARGRHRDPYLKPDWNPDLLLSQNLVSHLGVYRTDLVRELGGFVEGMEGSQDHDLALRVSERCGHGAVRHVHDVLYHWRVTDRSTAGGSGRKGYAVGAGVRAVQAHLDRMGRRATVERTLESFYRVRWMAPESPVRVVVLATGASGGRPADSEKTQRSPSLRLEHRPVEPGPERAARLNAAAGSSSAADVLVFVGEGCELTGGALEELVAHALRPEVGVAGGKIVSGDGVVRHGGYLLSFDPVAPVRHSHAGLHADEPGHFGRNNLAQNYLAVSADAMAVRRDVFATLGGFDADAFPGIHYDVDLGLRCWASGLRVVWSPWARVIANGQVPRLDIGGEQSARLVERWASRFAPDPFWHPALDRAHSDFRLGR